MITAFVKAFVTNMSVLAVWYALEWMEFGELQWNRDCDNTVWGLYLVILYFLFRTK